MSRIHELDIQYRPTVAEVDLSAIAHNVNLIRNLVGPRVKVCPAVKAAGYGHGAVEVSRACVDSSCEMLAVSSAEEGIKLREAGISTPILIMQTMLPNQIPHVLAWDLRVMVCSLPFASELSAKATAAGEHAKVHIKVDTGMGRIGVAACDAVNFAIGVSRLPNIEIEGVFTHFSTADEDNLDYTYKQLHSFLTLTERLKLAGVEIPIRHAANSAAILKVPESYLDMVRPGIITYGLYDGKSDVDLRQAITLKTKIVFLRELSAGEPLGYGRTFLTSRRSRIAVIPIGYADGYSRLLSNRASALVRGIRVPVVGRISMDQTLLDVTDVDSVCEGDEVVLYGSQCDQQIRIEEVAASLDTVSHEVITTIGKRVPRTYVTSAHTS